MSQPGNDHGPSRVLSDLFSQRLETCEGKERIGEYGGEYIRRRLLEVSFARKIIPPEYTPRPGVFRRMWWWILRKLGLLKRPVDHDTLVKIVDVEPKSRAMAVTFRGQPTASFERAKRDGSPFFTGEADGTEDEQVPPENAG